MPDGMAIVFAAGVVTQLAVFGALCFAPDRLPRAAARALLAAGAGCVAVYAARDADYTLLAGELLLGAAGWRMAGTFRPDAGSDSGSYAERKRP